MTTVARATRSGFTRHLRVSPQNVVRLLIALVALAMLVGGHVASAATDVDAKQGRVTFGVQPADVKGMDPRSFFSFGVTPGAAMTDSAAILNFSERPLRLTVYATDAITTDGGGLGLLQANEQPSDAGSWITLGAPAPKVVVPARTATGPGRVEVPFQVSVPVNASPGDHVAGIVASLTTVSQKPDGTNVRLEQRIASRVYVRVSGTLAPKLQVSDVHASYHGGLLALGSSTTVTYTLKNTGNVKLGGIPAVTVSSLFGMSNHASELPAVPLLLPGGSVTLTASVDGVLPQGLMTAHVDVVPVPVTSDRDPSIPTANGSAHFWAIPWLLLLLAVAGIAGGLWYLRRRGRANATPAAPPNPAREEVSV